MINRTSPGPLFAGLFLENAAMLGAAGGSDRIDEEIDAPVVTGMAANWKPNAIMRAIWSGGDTAAIGRYEVGLI